MTQSPFASVEDVVSYLGGDRITCLLCGKSYQRLSFHLSRVHQMGSEVYKAKFGLPPDCVLICADLREQLAAAALENWRDPQVRERTNSARNRAMADPAVLANMSEAMKKVWERDGFPTKWAAARWGDPNFRAKGTPKQSSWRVAKTRRAKQLARDDRGPDEPGDKGA